MGMAVVVMMTITGHTICEFSSISSILVFPYAYDVLPRFRRGHERSQSGSPSWFWCLFTSCWCVL